MTPASSIGVALLAALLSLPAAAAPPAAPLCAAAETTLALNECLQQRLAADDGRLKDYLDAAGKRVAEALAAVPAPARAVNTPTIDLARTQRAWLAYRKAHCGDVYTLWIDGSARNAEALQCHIAVTRERTHDVWAAYLTFMDRTPPVLPEP